MSKPELEVIYKDGNSLGLFYPDFIVEKSVVVEIKSVDGLCDQYFAQTLNYLKASNLELGLLINFGVSSLQIKRLANKHFKPQI